MKLGEKIRRLRGDQTRSALAVEVDTSTTSLLHIESGERKTPSVWIIAAIARYFNVPLNWLVDEDADFPPPAEDDKQRAVEIVENALTVGGLGGELSAEEVELIAAVRRFSPEAREKLDGVLVGLALMDPSASAKARHRIRSANDRTTAERESAPKQFGVVF